MTLMNAVVFPAFGPPDVFRAVRVDRPEPGPGEALVRIHAAGICYHDVLSRAGRIPRDRPGQILGHEISGVVEAVGVDVPAGRVGERVVIYQRLYCGRCANCLAGRQDLCRNSRVLGEQGGGGYAEYCCVPERNLITVPDVVDLDSAALAVCPVGTSIRALVGVAEGKAGDTVLVTGAGGGLGLHQIQLARALHMRVIAVTSSPEKVEAIRAAGAHEVVVSTDGAFSAEVWRLTGKEGVNVVLENVVSTTLGESLRSCAARAAVVILGNVEARPVSLDPGLVIGRRLRICGSGNATYGDVRLALHLMATGAVKPFIHAALPFRDVGEGHRLMESRKTIGRVLLKGW
ncbi:alcohol dehydrogenase catalytic domain-containing protein [Azorhizobium doebereinerae]|uniref:alcohol dehydrogenase catalytic domain-containing protein n=1 Tax=Azorhizobium doebereinerae TaxID=281091 RepID=UPI000427FD57|nr:alcohol dehydrogenase catalytic domain-containing protein [Azorhizobium doebereinerae]